MRLTFAAALLLVTLGVFGQTNDPATVPDWVVPLQPVESAARIAEFASPPPLAELPDAAVSETAELERIAAHNRLDIGPKYDGFERELPAIDLEVPASTPSAPELQQIGVDGDVVWSASVRVDGAHDLRVHFANVSLPAGARLWVYAPGKPSIEFGPEIVSPEGDLYTPTVEGEVAFVELRIPAEAVQRGEKASFRLVGVVEGFVLDAEGTPLTEGEPTPAADCTVDATCIGTGTFDSITAARGGIAHIRFVTGGNSSYCTGGLLNDTTSSLQPYMLTANHCLSTQSVASTVEAYWDYRTSTCGGSEPSRSSFPRTLGATLLATQAGSDFTFLRLTGSVPLAGRWYLGWTTSTLASNTQLHRVSHPSARPQKYSSTRLLTSGGITCSGLPRPSFLYSAGETGTTLGGSSGSPVLIAGGYVVGQQYGFCHFNPYDVCNYSTFNTVDGAFATTYPSIAGWLAPSVSIQSHSLSRTSLAPGESFTITENLSTSAPMTLILGASIRRSGTTTWISDPARDVEITTASGSSTRSRNFVVPAGTAGGTYDLALSLVSDADGDNAVTANDRQVYFVTFPNAISVTSTCTYTLSPGQASFPSAGGGGSFSVNTNSGCTWTASSNAPSWVTITGGSSGNGSGTVFYSVAPNAGPARNGTIAAAGQTFSISQSGCSYSISPSSAGVGASGGSGSIAVTATSGCSWTATSFADWIIITSGASGTGSGTSFYTVSPNSSASARQGTVSIAGLSFVVTQAGSTAPVRLGDHNQDGKGDIFWWNSNTRDAAVWLMNGTTRMTSGFVENGGANWIAAGIGDFNGDGRADTFWRNTATGENAIWFMNGIVKTLGSYTESAPLQWSVAGIGDFNGDGRADVLWRTSGGENAMWLMNGATKSVGAVIESAASSWVVGGVGDLNADGRADIFWRNNSTSETAAWLMNGTTKTLGALVEPSPIGWHVTAVRDFDGDLRADVLWRHVNGDNAMWLMNGATKTYGTTLEFASPSWRFVAANDYNGDGRADILWRDHATGANAMWLMNGPAKVLGSIIDPASGEWRVIP